MLKGGDEQPQHMVEMLGIAILTTVEGTGNLVEIRPRCDSAPRGELRIGQAAPWRELARKRALPHQLGHR